MSESTGRPADWPAHLADPEEMERRAAAYRELRYDAQARRGRRTLAREQLLALRTPDEQPEAPEEAAGGAGPAAGQEDSGPADGRRD